MARSTFLSLPLLLVFAICAATCPFLGPYLPPPSVGSLSKTLAHIQNNITADIAHLIKSKPASIAVQLVSGSQPEPILEYYHKEPAHLTFGGHCPKDEVDGDTVFRIGSITKMFTVYALLLECGFQCFEDPIVKYIPELRNRTESESGIDWDDITIGALASQISGIGRDYALYDLAAIQSPSTLVSLGFPPLDAVDPQLTSKVPSCGFNWTDTDGCDSSEALDLIVQQNPEFLPWDTPAYSNTQYQLIGRVLEILTNNKETYEKIMRTRVYEPLNLTRTWTFAPSDNEVGCGIREAGPKGELHEQAWSSSLGSEVPAGGSYMSINDMARHIRAVLTNEQLTRTQTRRWLKPSSFQGHMMGAVGMPWEIIRVDRETKGVYDVYRKDGGTPYYGESVYGIVDRWNVGYTVMMMFGEQRGDVAEVEEVIVTYLVKALEQAAESEAKENVAGRFVGDEGGAGNKSKNEIVVSVDDDGLFIERWSSNGTDFLESYKNIAMRKGAKDIRFGLHPSKADDKGGDKDIRQAYRFVLGGKPPWYGCHSWVELDLWRYAQEPLDELVFVKDSENGNVRSIEWLGGRVKLQRAE